ncbi:Sucrose transport protein SUC5 [Vitis vinifera]|uniref:Sucrose transport protein SUC5 n=1 Tax=Vitis vinifera TaxID=29760 RepID=A0A438DNW0_VITVI|nr:Sucrose transport protein SUC5 [Vitis vinifera]
MWVLLLVTCLNWIGWFPFLLFDTDWMGREVYGGTVGEGPRGRLYDLGVRAASWRHSLGGELHPPPIGIKAGALSLFAVMGVPLAITYSIPFALASIFCHSSGAGQGLSLGVLKSCNCCTAGAFAAALSGVLALTMLPAPPPDVPNTKDERTQPSS